MIEEFEGGQKKKLKKKQKINSEIEFSIGETFDVGSTKDKDFELDLDAAKFQGKKGQAGTRTKSEEEIGGYYFSP